MKLEQLISFLEIMKHTSISQAASKLGCSQQALSKKIKLLEDELGVPLLERTSNGSILTKYGELLSNFAEETVNEYQNVIDNFYLIHYASQIISKSKNELKILANPIFVLTILPPLVRSLHRLHPEININLYENNTPNIYDYLQKHRSDSNTMLLGIGSITYIGQQILPESLPPLKSKIIYKPLVKGNFVVYVSKHSPLAQYKTISVKEVFNYPLIMYAPDGIPDPNIETFLRHYGNPIYSILASNMGIIVQYVAMNLGISILIAIDETNTFPGNTDNAFNNLSHKSVIALPIEEDSSSLALLLYNPELSLKNSVVQDFIRFLPFPNLL